MHAGFVVPRDQTRELKRTGIGELPDDFAGFAFVETHRVGIVMFHIHLGHRHLVFGIALDVVNDKLMLQLTLVHHVEPDRFALFKFKAARLKDHLAVV